MRSKSFEMQEVKQIGQKEAGEIERLSHFVYGNNGRDLPDGRKRMQCPEKIENVKKKIYARGSRML